MVPVPELKAKQESGGVRARAESGVVSRFWVRSTPLARIRSEATVSGSFLMVDDKRCFRPSLGDLRIRMMVAFSCLDSVGLCLVV